MKVQFLILSLLAIFTWNAFGKSVSHPKNVSLLTNDKKILVSSSSQLNKALSIELMNQDQILSCRLTEPLSRLNTESPMLAAQDSTPLTTQWSIIANGASLTQRTIALYNSTANKVVLLNCSKSSAAIRRTQASSHAGINSGSHAGTREDSSPKMRESSAITDSQVIEVLRSANIEII